MTIDDTEDDLQDLFHRSHKERYAFFIDQVVENEETWGLYKGRGWCLAQAEHNARAVALWPHPALAQSCAEDTWVDAIPTRLSLSSLLNELLPSLAKDGLAVVVFPLVEGEGIVVRPKDLYQQIKRTQFKTSR